MGEAPEPSPLAAAFGGELGGEESEAGKALALTFAKASFVQARRMFEVTLPLGATKLSNWLEASGGALAPLSGVDISSSATTVKLKNIELDDEVPLRLLVASGGWD